MADTVSQTSDLYQRDEHAWIELQVSILQTGDLAQLDCANLIEVLSDMA